MNTNLPFWPEWMVEDKIGQGSYGVVYRIRKRGAGSSGTDIYSAVKVLRIPNDPNEISNLQSQGMDEASVRALLKSDVKAIENEIRVMISLASAAGIVTIEDYHIEELRDRIGWQVYIRMELLESIPAYIKRKGALTREETIEMGCDLCDALKACESVNIIHRDIKPANIFRNRFGQFKLGDFGVAKQMENTRSAATRIGTPSFEAPELFFGQKYDQTVDIYGLGMVLYTYLNQGRKPFYPPWPETLTRENMQEALEKRLSGQPVPPVPGVDDELYRILEKACAFQSFRRYQNAAEMKEDLERYRYNRKKSMPDTEKYDQDYPGREVSFPERRKTLPQEKRKKPNGLLLGMGIAAAFLFTAVGVFLGLRIAGRNGNDENKKKAAEITENPTPVLTASQTPSQTDTPVSTPTNTQVPSILISKASPTPISDPWNTVDLQETITIGTYEQDNDPTTGKENIEWIILAREGNHALVVSKYALDCQRYTTDLGKTTWNQCTLRTWLNETFFTQAFTEAEQQKILTTTIRNTDNLEYGTDGGESTRDRIFLLSIEEAERYFPSDPERACSPTAYVKAQRAFVSSGNCWWWLRSPGNTGKNAAFVSVEGTIDRSGNIAAYDRISVRPAFWIDLGT